MNTAFKIPFGVACLLAGGATALMSGLELVRHASNARPLVSIPVVILAALALMSLGAAADLLGWIKTESDQPETPKNTLVHGAARPASEAETRTAARGAVTPKPAHESRYPD